MSEPSAPPMVVVLGTFDLDPADRDAFMASRAEQVVASRSERGNIDYAFSADALDAGRVHLTELWATEDDFKAHVARIATARGPDGAVEVVPIAHTNFTTFRAAPMG